MLSVGINDDLGQYLGMVTVSFSSRISLELSKKVQLENTLMQKPIAMLLEKAPFPGILLGASPPDSMCKSSAGCSKP